MKSASYRNLVGAIIAAWFVFSLAASAFHLFKTAPGQPPVSIALAASIPVALFLAWLATSEAFRDFVQSLSARTLTIVQSWRVGGFLFLVLYTYRILPGMFALPAGWGDIAIGATAPLVALKLANPDHRRSFIFWQILGMADLAMAVSLGAAASVIRPHGIVPGAMAVLPLSLIPTFAVPLLLILHIICIAQALRWKEQLQARPEEHLSASAA
jgi:hypothetical protein